MTKKTVTNIDLVIDQLALIIDFNMNDSLDPIATSDNGLVNRWHNASGFFLLGSRAKGSTLAFIKAKDRRDKLDTAYEAEILANGAESIKAVRLGERLDKANATEDNARHLMEIDQALFEIVQGESFGGQASDREDQVKWFDLRCDAILNPEETAPVKRDLNAEMAARRKAG